MSILLNEKLTLTEKDEKTNVPLHFEVKEDITELEIRFSYSPKLLTDEAKGKEKIEANILKDARENFSDYPSWESFMPLKNLITLSLDSPDGYVGAAHRQSPDQLHRISADFADVGFDPTEMKQGTWILTLNVHGIVTEKVDCQITVSGK